MFNANTGAVTTHCAKCSVELCVALTATERASGELGRRFCPDGCKRSARKSKKNDPEQVEKAQMKVTAEIRRKVLELHGEGRSLRQIKEEIGISPPTIQRIVKEARSDPKPEASPEVSEPKTGIFRPPPLPPMDDEAQPLEELDDFDQIEQLLKLAESTLRAADVKARGAKAISALLTGLDLCLLSNAESRPVILRVARFVAKETGITP